MRSGKANVIIDGQWGSTGKGKLAGYLALKHDIAAATCDFMSNAGHTFVSDSYNKIVTCQLPTSLVNSDCLLLINAGAAITVEKLLEEIEWNAGVSDRLFIHPHAAVITEEDRKEESRCLKSISSTLKGCGGVLARKVMRTATLAKDEPRLKQWIGDTTSMLHLALNSGGMVIVEGAQGYDLSINHGFEYPYVTSRDVTTMSLLNHAGLPFHYLGDVYGCIRTYPIRVGNMVENGKMIGTSGPCHHDQEEISWGTLQELSGTTFDIQELTTVTKKIRRVFTFSKTQIKRFIEVCAPNYLFVNFINHINGEDYKERLWCNLSEKSKGWIWGLTKYLELCEFKTKVSIKLIGTGECNCDMVEM